MPSMKFAVTMMPASRVISNTDSKRASLAWRSSTSLRNRGLPLSTPYTGDTQLAPPQRIVETIDRRLLITYGCVLSLEEQRRRSATAAKDGVNVQGARPTDVLDDSADASLYLDLWEEIVLGIRDKRTTVVADDIRSAQGLGAPDAGLVAAPDAGGLTDAGAPPVDAG